jgi:hypothetical protein
MHRDWECLGGEIDPEHFRIPREWIGDLTIKPEPPRHQLGETFIRGPIPWRWLAEASRLSGSGFAVAMGVWYLARRFRRDVRAGVPELADWLGLGCTSIRTGLRLAEAAELVSVTRAPGRKLVLSLRELGQTRSTPQPLRGPIPWSWWQAATRLPGSTLRVGAVCWTIAGWCRSAEFTLALDRWAELGLSRFAVFRGLNQLDDAGLVSVDRRPGRSPVVTLRDGQSSGVLPVCFAKRRESRH